MANRTEVSAFFNSVRSRASEKVGFLCGENSKNMRGKPSSSIGHSFWARLDEVKAAVLTSPENALSQAGERPDNIWLVQVIGEDIDGHARIHAALLKEAKERLPCMGAEPLVLFLERCGLVVNGL